MNSGRQYMEGERERTRLIALKRRITNIGRDYDLDITDVIELVDRRILKLSGELERYQILNQAYTSEFPALQHLTSLQKSLIEARIVISWSQTDLADHLRLKPQQINKYEKSLYESIRLPKAIAIGSVLQQELDRRRS